MDLIASVRDGRLSRELAMMKGLGLGVLVVEGRQKWDMNGFLISRPKWSQQQQLGVFLSCQAQKVWLLTSYDLSDTIQEILTMERWLSKSGHTLGLSRPAADGVWGTPGNKDWQRHLLQGFDGIGPGMADRIIDHFGKVPLGWNVTEKELMEVKGLGKGRVGKMMKALE